MLTISTVSSEEMFREEVSIILSHSRDCAAQCVDVLSVGAQLAGGGATARHWLEVSQTVLPHQQQVRNQSCTTHSLMGRKTSRLHSSTVLSVSKCQLQCEPGPDFSLGERELEAALKVLGDIKVRPLLG